MPTCRETGSAMLHHVMWELDAAWGIMRVDDAEVCSQVDLASRFAMAQRHDGAPLCALLWPGAEGDRPLAHIEARHDARQAGIRLSHGTWPTP